MGCGQKFSHVQSVLYFTFNPHKWNWVPMPLTCTLHQLLHPTPTPTPFSPPTPPIHMHKSFSCPSCPSLLSEGDVSDSWPSVGHLYPYQETITYTCAGLWLEPNWTVFLLFCTRLIIRLCIWTTTAMSLCTYLLISLIHQLFSLFIDPTCYSYTVCCGTDLCA